MAGHGYYIIAGKKIANEYLTLATLGIIGGGVFLATRGGGKKNSSTEPPIKASSPDEEQFIRDFLKNAEADEKKETDHKV